MSVGYNPKIVTDGLVLCLDAANPKSFSPNVHPKPTDIYAWVTTGNNCTLSRDTISSPVGNTPLKMVQSGDDTYTNSYSGSAGIWRLAPAAVGQTWTVSVWVKASQSIQIEGCWIASQDSAGNYLAGGGSPNPTIGTDWTRISATYTHTNASTAYVGIRLDGTQTGGSGATIWWDGLQVERSSSATTFNPKTNTNRLSWWDLTNTSTGTLVNGPAFTSDAISFAYASSQQVDVSGSSYNFLGNAPYTLEAWVYPTRNPGASNWTGIFDRESNPGTGRDGYNLYFLGSAGTDTFFTSDRWCSGVNSFISVTVPQSSSVNSWNHIVLIYDGYNLYLYRNGSLVSSSTSVGGITNTTKTLVLGNRGGNYFDGKIANAKIYNKALTSAEVVANFNTMRGRYGV